MTRRKNKCKGGEVKKKYRGAGKMGRGGREKKAVRAPGGRRGGSKNFRKRPWEPKVAGKKGSAKRSQKILSVHKKRVNRPKNKKRKQKKLR